MALVSTFKEMSEDIEEACRRAGLPIYDWRQMEEERRRAREAMIDCLVGDIAGSIAVLRTERAGAPARDLTDDDCWERARNIAAWLLIEYDVKTKET